MPTYHHACTNEECEQFDVPFSDVRKMSEYDKEVPCPTCQQITKKLITKSSFALKGAGWFNTGGYGASFKPVGDVMKRSDSAK